MHAFKLKYLLDDAMTIRRISPNSASFEYFPPLLMKIVSLHSVSRWLSVIKYKDQVPPRLQDFSLLIRRGPLSNKLRWKHLKLSEMIAMKFTRQYKCWLHSYYKNLIAVNSMGRPGAISKPLFCRRWWELRIKPPNFLSFTKRSRLTYWKKWWLFQISDVFHCLKVPKVLLLI